MKAIKIKNVIIPEDKLLLWILEHVEDAELIDWEPRVRIHETNPLKQSVINGIKHRNEPIDDEF